MNIVYFRKSYLRLSYYRFRVGLEPFYKFSYGNNNFEVVFFLHWEGKGGNSNYIINLRRRICHIYFITKLEAPLPILKLSETRSPVGDIITRQVSFNLKFEIE